MASEVTDDDAISISHRMTVPEGAWPTMAKALRKVRVAFRDSGGFSRVVRQGDVVTFTATAKDTFLVMDTIDLVKKADDLMRSIISSRGKDIMDRYRDILAESEAAYERHCAETVTSAFDAVRGWKGK